MHVSATSQTTAAPSLPDQSGTQVYRNVDKMPSCVQQLISTENFGPNLESIESIQPER